MSTDRAFPAITAPSLTRYAIRGVYHQHTQDSFSVQVPEEEEEEDEEEENKEEGLFKAKEGGGR